MQPHQPPDNDPYRAVWQMSQVGDAAGHGRKYRWVAGIVAGVVALVPFALVTSAIWGFWGDEVSVNGAGFAVLILGFAAAGSLGGWVATSQD
jgi:peptidoglycan/LPS O-acetylase OafA/YrhL